MPLTYSERCKRIGSRIKQCRKEAHLTQADLLEKCYMSQSSIATLRRWERGEKIPDTDVLGKMCELFDCDMGYLLADYPTKRHETADVSEITGLSPEAVERLNSFMSYDTGRLRIGVLGLLLRNTDFSHFLLDSIIAYYDKYAEYKKGLKESSGLSRTEKNQRRDAMDAAGWRIQKTFSELIDDLMQSQYEKNEGGEKNGET